METDAGDVLGVSFQGLDTGLVLVIPDLDQPVVGPRDEIWLVTWQRKTELNLHLD